MSYYLANNNVQQGPFELHELPDKGLRVDSLVWREGMPDWKLATEVPEVAALLRGGPAPAPEAPASTPPEPAPVGDFPLQYQSPLANPNNGMAVASLVLGIVGLTIGCCYGAGTVPAILAIIFGVIARGRVRRGEVVGGDGIALAGIILGVCALLLVLVFVFLFVVTIVAGP